MLQLSWDNVWSPYKIPGMPLRISNCRSLSRNYCLTCDRVYKICIAQEPMNDDTLLLYARATLLAISLKSYILPVYSTENNESDQWAIKQNNGRAMNTYTSQHHLMAWISEASVKITRNSLKWLNMNLLCIRWKTTIQIIRCNLANKGRAQVSSTWVHLLPDEFGHKANWVLQPLTQIQT